MRIELTQAHIDAGERCEAGGCPVSLALNDATGDHWKVGEYEASREEGRVRLFALPLEVVRWVRAFDEGRPVEPFGFDLPVPEGEPCAFVTEQS